MCDVSKIKCYNVLHPWAPRVEDHERPFYWISWVALFILSGIIPLIVYYAGSSAYYHYQRHERARIDAAAPLDAEVTEEKKQLYRLLQKEMALTTCIDKPATNDMWLDYIDESRDDDCEQQPFHRFASFYGNQTRHLVIKRMGTFSKQDRKIIRYTAAFMRVFHRVEVSIDPKIGSLDDLEVKWKKKVWDDGTVTPRQYNSCRILEKIRPENQQNFYLVITSELLNSDEMQNHVFGSAEYGGPGVLSNYSFGNAKKHFRNALARMIKITAHEFGHMCYINHCSDYECNIGGYMHRGELDSRPFFLLLTRHGKNLF